MLSLVIPLALSFPNVVNEDGLPAIVARVAAPAGVVDADFADTIDLEGDWLVVGAPECDLAGPNWGAVFVYHRNAGGPDAWGLTQTLLPASNGFGGAVRLEGDTLVIGPGEYILKEVSIYSLVGIRWEHQKDIFPPPGIFNVFGRNVAIEGDTLAIGSGHWNCYLAFGDLEEVYVYERDRGGPDNWGMVTSVNGSFQGGNFGLELDLDGDVLTVAEPFYFGVCAGSSAPAFVFRRDLGGPDNWGLEGVLAPNGYNGSFGEDLDMDGDLAVTHDSSGVLVYDRNAGGPASWGNNGFIPWAVTGYWVSDVVLDGSRLYVGADWQAGTFEGEVRIFERHLGGENNWGQLAVLESPTSGNYQNFGWDIALDGERLAIAAFGDAAVYILEPEKGPLPAQKRSGPPVGR